MSLDPRRLLDDAAQERAACELLPRRGGVVRATFVRVERAGVVLTTTNRALSAGDDLRAWFALGGRSYSFEASVVRVGVPVPDRSAHGVLLGFIDGFTEGAAASPGADSGRSFCLLPPSGGAISLLDRPAQVVHVGVSSASFTLPADFKLVFVQSGRLQVEVATPGAPPARALATVRALSPGEGYLLYDLHFVEVEDPQAWREAVEALARTL